MILRFTIFYFSFLPFTVLAQWSVVPTLTVGFPVGEFSRNNNNIGVGLDLSLLRELRERPVSVGVQVAYLTFGRQQSNDNIETVFGNAVNANLTINHNIAYYHGMVRFKPSWASRVIPFADIITGAKTILTFASVSDSQGPDTLSINSSFNSTWAFDFGAAGGIEVKMNNNILFNLKSTFLSGTSINFINPRSARVNTSNDLLFDQKKVNGNLLMFHAGLRIFF
ncbi:hypothetical protein Fleli_2514 [Sporocytophaga myxococcoides]|uniref:Outer membrane protein beta-barrel domain-containing protein n=1 Tax=Sporocytophaga myxococcoides TaxID=153721 RepID=A0A098LBN0_9BACT|nr:hypothetical protein [Sporocytophaga myxococcoides]GAL84311.1 hypothetical protein Fleli_2514 [Sporocytophaga myxococcoides]